MVETRRVTFDSHGETLVGTLFLPEGGGRRPGLVLDGPLTSVKEQVASNYGRALAERGFVALAFDHRHFGESGGEPRQFESPPRKIEDIQQAVSFLSTLPEVDPARIGAVGVCAGGGYMAGAVAREPRIKAWGAVAGFFHDAEKQREWMGAGYEKALEGARAARRKWEETREVESIPAVGKGDGPVAMPLAEAYEYYGTPRGAVSNYVNGFAVMSREDTLPYDAQHTAPEIRIPTVVIHSEKALAPALARKFYDALPGPKAIHWMESQGQIDFYDGALLIAAASDHLASHFERAFSSQ
ncbi:MAG: dienelactone hydrolase family protein [Polyangiaceae bacterium]|nr:dienelactone hydrolase family protein [Polyangiaceae bacterium]